MFNHKRIGMVKFSVKAALWAGIIAGLVFLILEMVMVPLFLDGSPWGPPRMIGAIVMGEEVLPPPATFELNVVLAAVILHLVLSIIYAMVIGYVIRSTSFGIALTFGAIAGFVIYLLNFYLMTDIWPWFEKARNWVSIFAHVIFGLAASWAYMKLSEPEISQARSSIDPFGRKTE